MGQIIILEMKRRSKRYISSMEAMLLVSLYPLFPLITAYQLPSPYQAKPPYSFGRYCNATDPHWWDGYIYVDLWGQLDIGEDSTVRVTHFDAIELRNEARLTTESGSELILSEWTRLDAFSNVFLRNSSSLLLSDHCAMECRGNLTLGHNASLRLTRFATANLQGDLILGTAAKLTLAEFSRLEIGNNGKLVISRGEIRVEEFSSLFVNSNAGLKFDADVGLTLRNHATLTLKSGIRVKLSNNLTLEKSDVLINGDNREQSEAFEYLTQTDFEK